MTQTTAPVLYRQMIDALDTFDGGFDHESQQRYLIDPVIRLLRTANDTILKKNTTHEWNKMHIIRSFTGSGKTHIMANKIIPLVSQKAGAMLLLEPSVMLLEELQLTINRLYGSNAKFRIKRLCGDSYRDEIRTIPDLRPDKFLLYTMSTQFFSSVRNRNAHKDFLNVIWERSPRRLGLVVASDESHRGVCPADEFGRLHGTTEYNLGSDAGPTYTAECLQSVRLFMSTQKTLMLGYTATPINSALDEDSDVFRIASSWFREPDLATCVAYNIIAGTESAKWNSKVMVKTRGERVQKFLDDVQSMQHINRLGPVLLVRDFRKQSNQKSPIDIAYSDAMKAYRSYCQKRDIRVSFIKKTSNQCMIDGQIVDQDILANVPAYVVARPNTAFIIFIVESMLVGVDIPRIRELINLRSRDHKFLVTQQDHQIFGRVDRAVLPPVRFAGDMAQFLVNVGFSSPDIYSFMTEYYPFTQQKTLTLADNEHTTRVIEERRSSSYEETEWTHVLEEKLVTVLSFDKAADLTTEGLPISLLRELESIEPRLRQKKILDYNRKCQSVKKPSCECPSHILADRPLSNGGFLTTCCIMTYAGLSEEERRQYPTVESYAVSEPWRKCLQVNHINGDHNEWNKKNLETIDSLIHSHKTAVMAKAGSTFSRLQ